MTQKYITSKNYSEGYSVKFSNEIYVKFSIFENHKYST